MNKKPDSENGYAKERHARDQFETVMIATDELNQAKHFADEAKNHLTKLLIEEGMYDCFTVDMRKVARAFR